MGTLSQQLETIIVATPTNTTTTTTTTTTSSIVDGEDFIVDDGEKSLRVVSDNNSNNVNPIEAWLPITESRNGSFSSVTFHLLSSGIGYQALLLPVAFATLGWVWGTVCFGIAFVWQLYTIWLLVQLHEPSSVPGMRYSRYVGLAIAAFGPKLGRWLAMFPVMYFSGGSCVMLVINGGGTLELLYDAISSGSDSPLNGIEWFLVFACAAILMAQLLPNLNSVTKISVSGAVTGILYCTLLVLSIRVGRLEDVSYDCPTQMGKSAMDRFSTVLNALGIILISFRGHNLVLEIQGTLPTSSKHPSKKPMWRGVVVSYIIIATCLFSSGVVGFWAYGNKVPQNGGMFKAFREFHKQETSKLVMAIICIIFIVNYLSSYQIYTMPTIDNWEAMYILRKKKRCSRCVRISFRMLFGGIAFFIAVAFPFLGKLAILLGGLTMNLTYTYPCFIWNSLEKGEKYGWMWWINIGLGCLGVILSILLVVAAMWNLVTNGIQPNFFDP
ncbi:hypothetical protein ACFE04_025217 [Oxalis oulophora]